MQYEKEEINGIKCYRLKKRLKDKIQKNKADATRKTNRRRACSRSEREKFYKTREWLSIRFEALSKYGHRCMSCGADRKDTQIHVDHIIPISKDWGKRLKIENLQVLCRECNIGKRNWSQKDLR